MQPGADVLDLLSRLVAFDTVSSKPNLDLIAHAAEVLESAGIRSRILPDRNGTKANLLATIGPEAPGGLLLAGHSDVVPAEEEGWTGAPFAASLREERVYGRGTADMKGFIAVVLALVPEIAAMKLSWPVHLALTYDEETGCFGAAELAPLLADMPVRPDFCVVGEPTGMRVVNGHKGKLSIDCRVHGHEAHSAHNDRGVNAVEIAAELVSRFRALQRRVMEDGPRDPRFEPPHTTVHTGLMTGGTARNIVPRACRFETEIRNLPDQDPRALMEEIRSFAAHELAPDMERIAPEAGIAFETQSLIPALSPRDDGELLRLALAAGGSNGPDVVSFATEAGLYQNAGMDVIVCGPGHIRDAHRPDEFVALEQLARCRKFLGDLIRNLDAKARQS